MTSPGLPEGMTFRYEPRDADREAVREIVASTGFFDLSEIDVAVELVDERLKRGPASGYYFVFVDDRQGITHGYTCYGPIAVTHGSFDLYWIAVAQSDRGKGLGRVLLAETERLVRLAGGRRIYIETSNRQQYASTRGFYKRCEYELDALLKDFYAVGDDKAIYSRAV